MRNLFISYDWRDREFAERLAKSLEARGVRPLMSGHGTAIGSNWASELREQVKNAERFVLVMPEMSATSSNSTFFEAGVAQAFGKDVVVVVPDIRKVDRTNIPYDLAKYVVVDATRQPIDEVASTIAGLAEHAN